MSKRYLLLYLACWPFLLQAQQPELMPPMSHAAYVRACAISPDGQLVLTAAGYLDNTVLLWSASGKLLKILEGHQNDLQDAEIAPDGQHMLTLETGEWILHLWDQQGNKLKTFPGFNIFDACFSSDGRFFYAGTTGGEIRQHDLTGTVHRVFTAGEALITQVVCSPAGDYLAAGDDQGQVYLFDLEGNLLQSLDGHGAQAIESLAFSPDGRLLASGGHDQRAVIWDCRTGRVRKQLARQGSLVRGLAWSPDGQYLASAGPDESQIYLWDAQGNPLRRFASQAVNELLFTPDGQALLVAPRNKNGLIYSLQGELRQEFGNPASAVTQVAFAPTKAGWYLATGGEGTHVRLWDGVSGEAFPLVPVSPFTAPLAFNPQQPEFLIAAAGDSLYRYNLVDDKLELIPQPQYLGRSAMAYHPSGESLLLSNHTGGIQWWEAGRSSWTLRWQNQLNSNRVTSLQIAPDGKHFLVARDRAWVPHNIIGLAEDREQPYADAGFPAELRRLDDFSMVKAYGTSADQAVVSPDGQYVATNEGYTLSIYQQATGVEIFHAYNSPAEAQFPIVTCLAFAPNSKSVVAGLTANVLRQYDLNGRLLREYRGHRSTIRTVAFSPDGAFLLSGSSDNTAKLWDTKTGAELATLMGLGTEDWLVIAPNGLFDASPGAMEQLYYVAGLEIIALDQLKERYYEPGLLTKILGLDGEKLRQVSDLDAQNLALYPELLEATLLDDQIKVKLRARSGGIGPVSLRLGNLDIAPDVNPGRQTNFSINLQDYAGYFINGEINQLALVFYNAEGWLPSPEKAFNYVPGGKGREKPVATTSLNNQTDAALLNTLFALIVGTADYKGTALDLKFPDKDATAYRDMLQLSGAGLFGSRMEIRLLTTAKGSTQRPTKAAIRAALMDFAAKAKPNDVLVVYFSGHGTTWPENNPSSQFYYLSADNESFDLGIAANRQAAIAQDSLQAWIRGVKARKRILILDACNSGEIVKQLDEGAKGSTLSADQRRAMERMKDRAGFFVLASSSADKLSYEDPRFGHGLLTYSLLNNMPKVAALDKNSFIDVGKLFQEVREDVPKLASALSKTQEPKLIGMEDFSIGVIKPGTPFRLPDAKKIITRSDFSNKKRVDPLKLKNEVNAQLEALLANPELPFAYYPTDKAAGLHYFINGEYEQKDTAVLVTAWLYRSDQEEELETFRVEGLSSNLKGLAEQLLVQVWASLNKIK